jgi:hypothetical protein
MSDLSELPNHRLLTLPESPSGVLSIRAKALLFHDPRSADLLEHVERIARGECDLHEVVCGPLEGESPNANHPTTR